MASASTICDLCGSQACLVCPSDEASLCSQCDTVVHSANFLVARHRRTFLCRFCSNPTAASRTGTTIHLESHLCQRCHGSEMPCYNDDNSDCFSCTGSTVTDCRSDDSISVSVSSSCVRPLSSDIGEEVCSGFTPCFRSDSNPAQHTSQSLYIPLHYTRRKSDSM